MTTGMPAPIDAIDLLKSLIRCPSVTPENAGVLEVIEGALKPLGFETTRLRFEGNGSYPVDNLFATIGTRGPHLLFAGHTDVVPPGDPAAWTHPPFEPVEADGRIYGRGAADMKSGVAAFVAAAADAAAAGLERGRLSLLITNDEEADSINGTEPVLHWARAKGHRFDFAIVGEPSSIERVGDSIKIGRRGSLSGEIVVTGVQGHAAYPDRANNPIPVAAAVVTALKSMPPDTGSAYFPATNLEVTSIDVGNQAYNVIPGEVRLRYNVRFNDNWTPETLAAWMRQRIASVEAHGTTIALLPPKRPSQVFVSPTDGPVALLADVIAAQTGRPPQFSTTGGTSDARFVAQFCPVAEFGLVGPSLHKVDENVAIADVHALTAIYRAFIEAFFRT